jgi:UPF0176 protein
MPVQVAAFYQFAALPAFRELRAPLSAVCAELKLNCVALGHGLRERSAGYDTDE